MSIASLCPKLMCIDHMKINKCCWRTIQSIRFGYFGSQILELNWIYLNNRKFNNKKFLWCQQLFDYLKSCKSLKKKTYEIEAIHKAVSEFKKLD